MNDDGLTDILVGYASSPCLAVYLRTGSATFTNAFDLDTGSAPAAVLAQDINGDNRTDIACVSPASRSISVWFQNDLAPVAVMNGPSSQYEGVNATFSGARSEDSYSDIGSLNYTWMFGDSSVGYGKNATHSYPSSGNYTIELVVTDRSGLSNETYGQIDIMKPYPIADLTIGPSELLEGNWLYFNDTSELPNITGSHITHWQWAFDGNIMNTTENATYHFLPGEHNLTLTVTDSEGLENSTSRAFIVSPVQPISNFTVSTIRANSITYFNSTSWSPLGDQVLNYTWSFGDGSFGYGNKTSHIYGSAGGFYITLTVTDHGGSNSSEQMRFLEGDPTISADFSYQYPTTTSGEVLFNASGSTSSYAGLEYSWNFGTGNGRLSSSSPLCQFKYSQSGRYMVTLTVTDQFGWASHVSSNITINIAPPIIVPSIVGTVRPGETIFINATVTDPLGVNGVVLRYRVGSGNWTNLNMSHSSVNNTYICEIGPQTAGSVIDYTITATDANSNNDTTPQQYQINVKASTSSGGSTELIFLVLLLAAAAVISLFWTVRWVLVPVDDVFVIYEDGRLISHQTRRLKPGMDDDILGSMLIAIQSFVKDSFKDESSTILSRMDFGEKKILVERGERFFVAAVLHSNRTGSVPNRIAKVIDEIQREFGPVLGEWDGDLEKVRGVKDISNGVFEMKVPVHHDGRAPEKGKDRI